MVAAAYRQGFSESGACGASRSAVLTKIAGPEGHHDLRLDSDDLERLATWMDTYAQRAGSFGPDQEARLEDLRRRSVDLLVERSAESP
jgi:hypothetical protein